MQGPADESVGVKFEVDLLKSARDKTLLIIETASRLAKPGMNEAEMKKIIADIQNDLGSNKNWHPPQIRFGENSVLPFGAQGIKDQSLRENDIFFMDIGPIFEEHEGDVGRAYCLGNDLEMKRCCEDVEKIWHLVRNHWQEHSVTGPELYEFAQATAEKMGWQLSFQKANGHRISDFPHAAKARGSIQGFEDVPAANRWILEIQIRHPTRNFGAFYEDLLN